MKKALVPAILIGLVLAAIGLISWWIGVNNTEVQLRQKLTAQVQRRDNHHDQMWKIIQQKAQVSSQYAGDFERIFPDLIAGRYSQGDGTLMKWIQEANPDFDTSLYQDLMRSIEAERKAFTSEQDILIDVDREYKTFKMIFPNSLIIGSRPDVEFKVITSTLTDQAAASGADDNVDLFNR